MGVQRDTIHQGSCDGDQLIGGYFDEHPWGTFDAPVIVEDPAFPGVKQWPSAFTISDEIYQIKNFSRTTTRVLVRLDPSKLDLNNPRVYRTDADFAVTWARMYGQGRVFYSTLGHVEANWDRPEMQTMIAEAIMRRASLSVGARMNFSATAPPTP
ncbi:Cytochrome c551/c552 [Luteitalea pratensis]|uniref:Cytochrome c551/c552 n=1 Tax=Luteitalea pratensis TaxID=1855912 RepID=A0A143PN48_LUTPR|nr:ThuA domain-containing protein [Luteitalea pratensis]AMY09194.1 Cytochrome c551/c552 [Luteitalea pratensis]